MALDNALFWIERSGVKHFCKGENLEPKMVSGDVVWVQRGTEKFRATYDGSKWDAIADTDWLWAQKDDVKYKVSGKNF